jgi:hypothetical protein
VCATISGEPHPPVKWPHCQQLYRRHKWFSSLTPPCQNTQSELSNRILPKLPTVAHDVLNLFSISECMKPASHISSQGGPQCIAHIHMKCKPLCRCMHTS